MRCGPSSWRQSLGDWRRGRLAGADATQTPPSRPGGSASGRAGQACRLLDVERDDGTVDDVDRAVGVQVVALVVARDVVRIVGLELEDHLRAISDIDTAIVVEISRHRVN